MTTPTTNAQVPPLPVPFYFVSMAADSHINHTPYHTADQMHTYAQAYAAQRRQELEAVKAALVRLLSSDKNIAQATEDELTEAANNLELPDLLREQAAAILQARAALSNQTKEQP